MRFSLWTILVACVLGGVAAGDEVRPTVPRSAPARLHLPEAGSLPLAARDALALRMSNHAADLDRLLAAALTLNHRLAEDAAKQLAATPRIGRPVAGDLDSLAALLPPRFFDLQDRLAQQALEVARAAHLRDDRLLSKSMGALTQTCVECHSVYLNRKGDEPRGSEDDSNAGPGGNR
jgi:hypothetical protein